MTPFKKPHPVSTNGFGIDSLNSVALVAIKWLGRLMLTALVSLVIVALFGSSHLAQIREIFTLGMLVFMLFSAASIATCAYVNLTNAKLGQAKPDTKNDFTSPLQPNGFKGDFGSYPSAALA
jgi:hypothetical protein